MHIVKRSLMRINKLTKAFRVTVTELMRFE